MSCAGGPSGPLTRDRGSAPLPGSTMRVPRARSSFVAAVAPACASARPAPASAASGLHLVDTGVAHAVRTTARVALPAAIELARPNEAIEREGAETGLLGPSETPTAVIPNP